DLYSFGTNEYRKGPDGVWRPFQIDETIGESDTPKLQVQVRQTLNDPPTLVAKLERKTAVIWDPNPQLANVQLAAVGIYQWKDSEGRSWRGGLFKPTNYQRGGRYPLVIQTHGFTESRFIPSGVFPTAFAA